MVSCIGFERAWGVQGRWEPLQGDLSLALALPHPRLPGWVQCIYHGLALFFSMLSCGWGSTLILAWLSDQHEHRRAQAGLLATDPSEGEKLAAVDAVLEGKSATNPTSLRPQRYPEAV